MFAWGKRGLARRAARSEADAASPESAPRTLPASASIIPIEPVERISLPMIAPPTLNLDNPSPACVGIDLVPALLVAPAATKQCLTGLAQALGVELVDLEGKPLTVAGLETAIGESLKTQQVFLIWDNAHRLQVSLRGWLERLHEQGQPMLLLATHPPARDIFLRLPRIELKPLKSAAMRALMQQRAEELGMSLHDGQIAALLERCGGNPMLARRVVWEEFLGLEDLAPDHTQWVDGTPFLVAFLMCFMVVRFIGRGLGSTSLYLLGAMLTVAVGVVRLLLLSLPRRKGRLGQ